MKLSINGFVYSSVLAPPPRYAIQLAHRAFFCYRLSTLRFTNHRWARSILRIPDYCHPSSSVPSSARGVLLCAAARLRRQGIARTCARACAAWRALLSSTSAAHIAAASWHRSASRALQLHAAYVTHLLLRRAEARRERGTLADFQRRTALARSAVIGWASRLALLRIGLSLMQKVARRRALQVTSLC